MATEDPISCMPPVALKLRDGRWVTVRPVRGDDGDALQAAVGRLSLQSRYSRFMTALHTVPDALLESATHPIAEREFALVVTSDDGAGDRIVAGCRFAPAGHDSQCEFAVTVDDAWQGLGLAKQLMLRLIDSAKAYGYRGIEGHVLASNMAMRGLARHLGFRDSPQPGDWTERLVSLALDGSDGSGVHEAAHP
ncbi:GNAT family N-acetyltransferase [Caldimonas brevitalea]|uniref:Acetyl-CoA synthetase n=1 Tax=Caldimonas brevitalea TaxID=413882 RepID=A0A0G3BIR6_9BURK|nr:GNAT family N-acetyltransferase [Caldimonas brevitalea]AKJ29319.1 acetyl-CoA synthetase [Caldimonas brevitalea]